MARKIPLRTVQIANGFDRPVNFSYAETLTHILAFAQPGQGLTMDEVLRATDAMAPLKRAIDEGAEYVTFSEEQYKVLTEKLNIFPFAIATSEIADFGLAVRNAPEIT